MDIRRLRLDDAHLLSLSRGLGLRGGPNPSLVLSLFSLFLYHQPSTGMASADPDAIAALMERMGLPSHTISAVLNDPIALSRLSKTPIAPPQLPTYDNPVERVGQQVDAAKRAAAEEAARPQRKIPPPPRRALVYSLKAERDAISNAAESRSQTVVSTSFLGLPKAFSDKPLSELTKGEFFR